MELIMSESHIYPVSAELAEKSLLTNEQYLADYQASINDPEKFWGEKGKILDWITPYTKVKNSAYDPGHINIKWFEDGQLNVSANCIDRHLATKGDQVAILWEGDSPDQDQSITYNQLHQRVCKFANALKAQNVKR
jgi:acetyl-CoA synthetase